ncbi:MAG: Gfo/Idh/MocA family oxidoreductase [Planctomycetaceae bacterium]|nr:Gfo/Idh/MocA family oxidoreductase [Planctomycetaceae bacterium]
MPRRTDRRSFLKTSGAVAAGAALVSAAAAPTHVHAAGSDEIQVALIGCGGRGNGALRDRAQVGDNFKVVAVADAFEGNAKNSANGIRGDAGKDNHPLKGKVDLPDDHVFYGLDAYKKAISVLKPGDQIVIATPPGFRPFHYKAAVDKGLHVFMEKPACIDAPGYKLVMEANKIADEKNLKVVVGFQRRVEPHYYNWIEQIHGGKIGDIQFTRVYWNGGGIWQRNREPGESELHFQVRNWYHFVWLCGDNIVEQHAHNLDIGNWIHSHGDKMAHPIEANAQGGRIIPVPDELRRQAPAFSQNPDDRKAWDDWYQQNKKAFGRHGQAWDSFFVEYTYADGSKMFSQCRHIPNTQNNVSEYAYGTAGEGGPGRLIGRDKKEIWKNTEKARKGPYQWEHDELVKAIREDKPRNDGWFAANASMVAVLGREAAFCGKTVKWDELVAKGRNYFPNGEITSWDQVAPVQADADGFYEKSVAVPGRYNPFA